MFNKLVIDMEMFGVYLVLLFFGLTIGAVVGLNHSSWVLFWLIFIGPSILIASIKEFIKYKNSEKQKQKDRLEKQKQQQEQEDVLVRQNNQLSLKIENESKNITIKPFVKKYPINEDKIEYITDFGNVINNKRKNFIDKSITLEKDINYIKEKYKKGNLIFTENIKQKRNQLPFDNGKIDINFDLNFSIQFENEAEILNTFEKNKKLIKSEIITIKYVGINKEWFRSKFLVEYSNKICNLEDYAIEYYKNNKYLAIYSVISNNQTLENVFSTLAISDNELKRCVDKLPNKTITFLATHTAGMPDLFIYNKKENKVYFVEVKSQTDQLSVLQKYWFNEFIKFKSNIKYILLKINNITPERIPLSHITIIKGIQYRDLTVNYLDSILDKSNLILKYEPTNKYDSTAIKILYEGKLLGYIAKNFENKSKLINAIKNNCYNCFIVYKSSHTLIKDYRIFIEINFL